MGTAFARLHRGDQDRAQDGGCQTFVSVVLLTWLCMPWSSHNATVQRCIAAGVTVLVPHPLEQLTMVRAGIWLAHTACSRCLEMPLARSQ